MNIEHLTFDFQGALNIRIPARSRNEGQVLFLDFPADAHLLNTSQPPHLSYLETAGPFLAHYLLYYLIYLEYRIYDFRFSWYLTADRATTYAASVGREMHPHGYYLLRRSAVNALLYLGADCALGDAELIVRLQAHPYLRRRAEVSAQPDRGVCGDRTLAVHNGAYASWGDDDVAGEPVYADPHRPHQFLKKDLPRMNRIKKFTF